MVSRPALLLLAVSYTADPSGLFMTWLAAVLLHEGAHVAALYLCGGRVAYVKVRIFGAELREVPRERLSGWRTAIPVAAGPAANLLAAYAFAAAGLYLVSGVHLLMGLFNLLPLPWMDGGRLLKVALAQL